MKKQNFDFESLRPVMEKDKKGGRIIPMKNKLITLSLLLCLLLTACRDVGTENEITFLFNDMGEPNVRYEYTISLDKKEISMLIVYFTSTGDEPTEISKIVKINDERIWKDVKYVLNTDILEKSDKNVFGYKYYDAVNVLCYTLENIDYAQTANILYEKGIDSEEYWDSIYGGYDANKDGKVTYRESFDYHIELIIKILNNGEQI